MASLSFPSFPQRQALGMNQTKVTFKTFLAWKKRKRLEKMEAGLSAKAKREADFKLGRTAGISGREIFEFNPNLVTESCEADEDDESDVVYTRGAEAGEDEYNGPLREIDANTFLLKEEDVEDDA
ncbi:Zinc finger CCCH-type-containing 15, partial [Fasciola gigantica]